MGVSLITAISLVGPACRSAEVRRANHRWDVLLRGPRPSGPVSRPVDRYHFNTARLGAALRVARVWCHAGTAPHGIDKYASPPPVGGWAPAVTMELKQALLNYDSSEVLRRYLRNR